MTADCSETPPNSTPSEAIPVRGLYLQVYPSALINASRMMKIAKSVHSTGAFSETNLVGVQTSQKPNTEEIAPAVRIIRVRGNARRGNLGRLLRGLTWQPRVYRRYRKQPITVLAAHTVWVLPLCWALARRTGATLIYNAHELETETATMQGLKKKTAKFIERRLIHSCAIVSVVNGSIADWYVNEYGIDRPETVTNLPEVVDAQVNFRASLGIQDHEMLYVHTGHLVGGRNIPLILDAFRGSQHHVAFLGDGAFRNAVTSAAADNSNIHWVPPVPPHLIVAHTREADVGLCLIEHQLDLSDRFSSPNKLLEALAAGTPALCSELIEARNILGELSDAWIIETTTSALALKLQNISKADVADFKRQWTGIHTWDEEVGSLASAIASVARTSRSSR